MQFFCKEPTSPLPSQIPRLPEDWLPVLMRYNQDQGGEKMRNLMIAMIDVFGVLLIGKKYLLQKYTEQELADMGIKLN